MLFKPEYDENGKKILCEMNGINSEMLMDIYVKKMKKGEVLEICEDKNECAILLLSGDVTFKVEDEINERCKRKNPFEKKPYAIHFCKQVKASVTANEDSEVLVQMTDNEKTWKSEFYNPNNCLYQEFGKGQWNGTGHRIVSTMFDLDNAPAGEHCRLLCKGNFRFLFCKVCCPQSLHRIPPDGRIDNNKVQAAGDDEADSLTNVPVG